MPRPVPEKPGPGQESVWEYPRPPIWQPVAELLRVVFGGETIAATQRGVRVLETSHPPVYYLPPDDVDERFVSAAAGRSFCEFKGEAVYWDVIAGGRMAARAAWSYPAPTAAFASMRDYLAFYASAMDECWVGDEKVVAQAGDFYGGWITAKIVGPFKGGDGTWGW
ncbi:MAG: DUF427 domain-containing protein [Pseudomonadota bacterium]